MGGIRWEHDHDEPDEWAEAIEAMKAVFAKLAASGFERKAYQPVFADCVEDALEEAASVADYRAARLDRLRLVARELGYFNYLRRQGQ